MEVSEWYISCKPSQAKPSQIIPNYTFRFKILIVHRTPFPDKSGKGVFLFEFEKAGKMTEKTSYNEGGL